MLRDAAAIAAGLFALAAVAFGSGLAVGVGSSPAVPAVQRSAAAPLACTDYCPIGAHTASIGGF